MDDGYDPYAPLLNALAIYRAQQQRRTAPPVVDPFSASDYGRMGLLETGNVDLTNRPNVKNGRGYSSVYSTSREVDGRETLMPRVSDDGRILSERQALALFLATGKHLGQFTTPEHATAYAERLHLQQAAMMKRQKGK